MSNKTKEKQRQLNLNYFTKKDTLKYIGLTILFLGLYSLAFGWGIVSYILAILGSPTGIILFIVSTTRKSSEVDIENDLELKLKYFDIELENERKYFLKLIKNQKDIVIDGYIYKDGMPLKTLRSGVIRSNEFVRSKIRIMTDRLYILTRRVDLIESEANDTVYEIEYDNIKNLEISREKKVISFNGKEFNTKSTAFVITTENDVYSFPIVDAITSDDLIDNIKRHINTYNEHKQG